MRDERHGRLTLDQSRAGVLTGIMGARRAWTVSMISALSMPYDCRLAPGSRSAGSRRGARRLSWSEAVADADGAVGGDVCAQSAAVHERA
jgi:hypothetical protein